MPTATTSPLAALRTDLHTRLLAAYPKLISRLGWTREALLAHQRTRLQSLLRDAIAGSPFHARRLSGIDPAEVDPTDLRALPVMTKAQMMEELDDVFTDRRLTRADVEAALAATGAEPVPVCERHIAFAFASGSSAPGACASPPPSSRARARRSRPRFARRSAPSACRS